MNTIEEKNPEQREEEKCWLFEDVYPDNLTEDQLKRIGSFVPQSLSTENSLKKLIEMSDHCDGAMPYYKGAGGPVVKLEYGFGIIGSI